MRELSCSLSLTGAHAGSCSDLRIAQVVAADEVEFEQARAFGIQRLRKNFRRVAHGHAGKQERLSVTWNCQIIVETAHDSLQLSIVNVDGVDRRLALVLRAEID